MNGGAIALGHPLGASGARITSTLVHEMRRWARGSACRLCVKAAAWRTPLCSRTFRDPDSVVSTGRTFTCRDRGGGRCRVRRDVHAGLDQTVTDDPARLRMAPLLRWMQDEGIEHRGALGATLLTGGRSNVSYRIDDEADRSWVLRRPPLGHVLPSAHDMGREFRVLAGLNRVGLPAPHAVAKCEDERVLGAPVHAYGVRARASH